MNKIIVIIFLISITGLTGCEKSASQLCGGDDPATNLSWLKLEIIRLSALKTCNSISRSTYKEQTVFIFSNCTSNATSIPFLYDCDGKQLNLSPRDYQELKFTGDIELIWKSN